MELAAAVNFAGTPPRPPFPLAVRTVGLDVFVTIERLTQT